MVSLSSSSSCGRSDLLRLALKKGLELCGEHIHSLVKLFFDFGVVVEVLLLKSSVQVREINPLQQLPNQLNAKKNGSGNVKIVSKSESEKDKHEDLVSEDRSSAKVRWSLREGLLSVILSWIDIHQIVLVNPVLDHEVNENNHWDKRSDRAKEYAYCPNNSYEGQLITLVEEPSIFELFGTEFHVCGLQVEDELLKLARYVVRAIESVYRVAEKTETYQETREKVCRLKRLHKNGWSSGACEHAVKGLQTCEAEEWYQESVSYQRYVVFDIVWKMTLWPESEPHLERTDVYQLRDDNIVGDQQRYRCKLKIKLVAEISVVYLVQFVHSVTDARTLQELHEIDRSNKS